MKTPLIILSCTSLLSVSLAAVESAPNTGREVCRKPHIPVEALEEVARPETEAIPKEHAEEKEVAILVEELKPVGERVAMNAKLRIINPTDQPIHFTGFSVKSPITKAQHWKDGEWVDVKKFLRCGTGLIQCTIAPGQSATFVTAVYPQNMPTRIGITYTHGDRIADLTVWTKKIESES